MKNNESTANNRYVLIDNHKVYLDREQQRAWDGLINNVRNRARRDGSCGQPNIVQGLSRDVLCYAMDTLRHCFICGHVHDEVIIEADPKVSLEAIREQMSRTPPWAEGLILRADGYTTPYYKKD